jgi:hypothetical protein
MKGVGHIAHMGKTTNMRAIQKLTSGELLTKHVMRKKYIYTKIHTYLSYFSTQSPSEFRHLSYRGTSFCSSVPKKPAACELSHVLYCETLNKLQWVIQNKRRGMLTSCVVLLHDNAPPHRAPCTHTLLEHFNWELYDHTPYSPHLAPSNYNCLPSWRTS